MPTQPGDAAERVEVIEDLVDALRRFTVESDVFVDVFEGSLAGLIMAEAEFESTEAMENYPMPNFAYEEVT